MCAIYIFPPSICLFCCRKYVDQSWEYVNRSLTHDCGNWDWGCTIPRKGKQKWDFHCSVGRSDYRSEQFSQSLLLLPGIRLSRGFSSQGRYVMDGVNWQRGFVFILRFSSWLEVKKGRSCSIYMYSTYKYNACVLGKVCVIFWLFCSLTCRGKSSRRWCRRAMWRRVLAGTRRKGRRRSRHDSGRRRGYLTVPTNHRFTPAVF
jgi:hypothetical protein